MHFEWSITLGSALTMLSVLGVGIGGLRYLQRLDRMFWEHDLMWVDYLARNPNVKERVHG
jgi:hypothetical protein